MKVCDAFVLNIPSSHIYFIAYTEGNPVSKAVILNFTSHHPGKCDETCVVKVAEYSRLTQDSVVHYKLGEIADGEEELKKLTENILKSLTPIGSALMSRIKRGALKSPHTPGTIKRLLTLPKP